MCVSCVCIVCVSVHLYNYISLQFERLKGRVIQVTFSTPGIKAPSGEIADDALFDTLKSIVDERTELKRKASDTTSHIASLASQKKDNVEQVKKVRTQLSESVVSLCLCFYVIFGHIFTNIALSTNSL